MAMKQKNQKQPTRQINKKMIERVIIIHNAIDAGLYPNSKKLRSLYLEITGYANVGEATINRAIDILRTNFNAPLDYDRQKGGYYYFEKFDLKLNSIAVEDVFYLSAAKILLSSFEGSPMYKSISDVINFVTDTQGIGKSALLKRIAVAPAPKFVTKEETWSKVIEALQNNLIIEFDYEGRWNTEISHRRVRPYQILIDEGKCLLFGYSEERKSERLFVLNRMYNLAVTEEHFELPENFEFTPRCGGGKFGAFMGDEVYDFVIDFYGDACSYVKEFVWADNQQLVDYDDEEKTRITFSSTQWLSVLKWVLSQGENAIPVSPDWFVDEWKSTVAGMCENAKLE